MSEYPLTCCDYECARMNDCFVGGLECKRCGGYFCADELGEDGLCTNCANELETEGAEE